MSEFSSEGKDGVHLITCPSVIDIKDAHKMESELKTWLNNSASVHVLDFSDVTSLKQNSYRYFVLFNQALRAGGKALYCINVPPRLQPQIKQDGLTSVFILVSSIEEAKNKIPMLRPALDVEFINPFISSTRTVLEEKMKTPLTPGKAYLRRPMERIPTDLAGVIALTSNEFSGSISLCFRAEVYLKIYETMTGIKHDFLNSELEDVTSELLSLIFEHAKAILNGQKGFSIEKSYPSVLMGDALTLHYQLQNPAIILPFDSPSGAFHIEISVDQV